MITTPREFLPTDYGFNTTDRVNIVIGVFSLLIFGYWIFLPIFYLVGYHRTIEFMQVSFGSLTSPLQYFGIFLLTLAVLIQSWARFVRGKVAPAWGLHESINLVTRGPYRLIRHPNYLFYLMSSVGIFLATMVLPTLLTLPVYWGYIRVIDVEEQLLEHHFQQAYRDYKKSTWRLLPFLY